MGVKPLFQRAFILFFICPGLRLESRVDNLISQRDANDSLCNSILFHLASSSRAGIHLFSLIVFSVTVPETGFHRQNKKAPLATMAAEWLRYTIQSVNKILQNPLQESCNIAQIIFSFN